MNEMEKAIADLKQHAGRTLKTPLSVETVGLAVEALGEKAEKEKMRCKSCRHHFKKDYCTANGDEWFDCDSCSYFEPKENENG